MLRLVKRPITGKLWKIPKSIINSPIKFIVRGKAKLAKEKNKKIVASKGIVVAKPLKYLIVLVLCLLYNKLITMKSPELEKPCANISTIAPEKAISFKENNPKVTTAIWLTDE